MAVNLDRYAEVLTIIRGEGKPAVGLGIKKQRGANAVAVAQAVRAEMERIAKDLPAGMDLSINFDSTRFIEDSVHEIERELLFSVLLTALVCWLFLGSLSSTLNVVLAIPMSLAGTVAVIYFLGYTLNTFTLLALGLAVGIVVDDAIMVLENIYRHREHGEGRIKAASAGAGLSTVIGVTVESSFQSSASDAPQWANTVRGPSSPCPCANSTCDL